VSPDDPALADQEVGYTPVPLSTDGLQLPVPVSQATPALTLYQVPVPGAVQVQLPDGRTAWARPVAERLEPVPMPKPAEPMPAWAKAFGMAAGSLTVLALGSATALRIAAPALGVLVDLLDMIWRVALVLTVLLFGARIFARHHFHTADGESATSRTGAREEPFIFAPQIDAGGTRLLGRSGDVNIQLGDRNRNKQ